MADKIARSITGVRDVKVRLGMTKAPTKDKTLIPNFKIKLIVGEEVNVINIGDNLKQQLVTYLNQFVGVEQAKIDIDIESISNNITNNKKRVV